MRYLARLVPPLIVAALLLSCPLASQAGSNRPFEDTAEWNTPLPPDAPVWSHSSDLIAEMKRWSGFDWPRLTEDEWSSGVWTADGNDPVYDIDAKSGCYLPRALSPVSIPNGARPSGSADDEVLILDQVHGKIVRLWDATKSGTPGRFWWSACNSSVYFVHSNGLHQDARGSDDSRNEGWRGVPGNLKTVMYDEVADGQVRHVIAVGLDNTAACHFWPMVGDEDHSGTYGCEGLMLRIKPEIDLGDRGLTRGCLTIARALQVYGGMIADTGGVALSVELELLSLEGREEDWSNIGVQKDCMQGKVSFDDFEVVAGGYDRPPG